jgi:hypothetical protein
MGSWQYQIGIVVTLGVWGDYNETNPLKKKGSSRHNITRHDSFTKLRCLGLAIGFFDNAEHKVPLPLSNSLRFGPSSVIPKDFVRATAPRWSRGLAPKRSLVTLHEIMAAGHLR